VTTPITPEQRAQIVRDICRRESHRWADITTQGDLWRQHLCVRACGARMVGDPRGTVGIPQLRQLLDQMQDETATIGRFELIVEGK
jgi:hypothetical protein